MHVTRSFERWIDARWSRRNASIRELTLDLSLLPSTLLIDVGRSMQPGPRVNSSTHPSVSIFRHIRNETVCDINGAAYYRNRVWQIIERREREGRVRGGGNLVGGFHHRRDGTRRLQDVSDLSIFSTRSTMNVPVSEPLLGQTWIIILTSGVKLPDAICRYSTVFYGGISDVRRVTSGEERRFGKLHAFFMQQTFPRKRNKLKISG